MTKHDKKNFSTISYSPYPPPSEASREEADFINKTHTPWYTMSNSSGMSHKKCDLVGGVDLQGQVVGILRPSLVLFYCYC